MSDSMREEFEAAAKSRWPGNRELLLMINQPGTPADGQYDNPVVHHAWWAWQASRAAIEVDLEPDDPADDGAAYLHHDFVKSRIKAHGLKVK